MDRIRTINASGGEKKFCLFFSMQVLHSNISCANFMQYFTVSLYPFYDLNKNRNISSHEKLFLFLIYDREFSPDVCRLHQIKKL